MGKVLQKILLSCVYTLHQLNLPQMFRISTLLLDRPQCTRRLCRRQWDPHIGTCSNQCVRIPYVCRYSVELVIHITNITLNRYCHSYGIEQQNQRIPNEGCYAGTTNFIFNNVLIISRKYVESPSLFLPLPLSLSLAACFSVIKCISYILLQLFFFQMQDPNFPCVPNHLWSWLCSLLPRVLQLFCLEYRYYKYYDGEKDIKKWGRFLPCLKCMLNHLQKSIE